MKSVVCRHVVSILCSPFMSKHTLFTKCRRVLFISVSAYIVHQVSTCIVH